MTTKEKIDYIFARTMTVMILKEAMIREISLGLTEALREEIDSLEKELSEFSL